jgi:hypothetical protein
MERPRLSRRALLAGATALAGASFVPPWVRSAAAQAALARYAVEIVVFRQPGLAPPAPTVMGAPRASAPPGRIEPLPQAAWQLANVDGGLRRSSRYHLLGHAAWIALVPPNGTTAARVEDVLPDAGLSGAVVVQRGQYLFLRVELDYATPDGKVYQLRERRRIKFNERHYFDHPALGVVALVTQAPPA